MVMKRIKGYENYFVTSTGEVHSIRNKIKLKTRLDKGGYYRVKLYNAGGHKTFRIHRLVAEAFIPNLQDKLQVNHIDEDKTNNNVSNLNWMTVKENMDWGTRNKKISGKNNYKYKPKSYYATKTTQRGNFKTICKKQNWDFDSFTEIYSEIKYKAHKKYYYIRR